MNTLAFLYEDSWDLPFFKQLAANDTGDAPGHQGGLVIPKPLRRYFPILVGKPTPDQPTVEHSIKAVLVVDGQIVGTVATRYQIQTWRARRSAESRITGNLGPLRNQSSEDDFLVLQRSLTSVDSYRLWLIKKGTKSHKSLMELAAGKRWGTLQPQKPVTQQDVDIASDEIAKREKNPFTLFEKEPEFTESRSKRVARSVVFRETIKRIYNNMCALCNTGLLSPKGDFEVTAAHIVPRGRMGADDARNGLSLCRTHHWAFVKGLFGIDEKRRILVPKSVRRFSRNESLTNFNGQLIKESTDTLLLAAQEALDWHRENCLLT